MPTSLTGFAVKGDTGSQGPQGDAGATGATGATGADGPANTLTIGTVTEGGSAAASITGTAPSQTLNLTLPQGPAGPTGAQGPAGDTGPAGATGPQGDAGPQGPAGNDGATGATGATGAGVATGGGTGQYLVKLSNADYDTGWGGALSSPAGSSGDIQTNNGSGGLGGITGTSTSVTVVTGVDFGASSVTTSTLNFTNGVLTSVS